MTALYKISESNNGGILYVHNYDNPDDSNIYFNFRGEIESDKFKSDDADYGQIWVFKEDPTLSTNAQPVYNTYSSSLLGNLGVKTEDGKSQLIGGVTFLSTKYNGQFIFTPSNTLTGAYNIRLADAAGTAQNYYICYLQDSIEVGIVHIPDMGNPPAGALTTWTLSKITTQVPPAASQHG